MNQNANGYSGKHHNTRDEFVSAKAACLRDISETYRQKAQIAELKSAIFSLSSRYVILQDAWRKERDSVHHQKWALLRGCSPEYKKMVAAERGLQQLKAELQYVEDNTRHVQDVADQHGVNLSTMINYVTRAIPRRT